MKSGAAEYKNPYWPLMRWIVERMLPLGYREDYLGALDERQSMGALLAFESVSTIASAYWNHAVAAFNHWAFYLQAVLIIFCFGTAPVPWVLAIPLTAILVALAFRAAYTHHDLSDGRQIQPLAQYYMDSALDAVVAGVFMLASQALALLISPSAALPAAILYRGALVCLPLTAVLRMAFRPKPDPSNKGFHAPGATAEEIYRRAWRLNVLWLITFYGLIILNVSEKPNSLPDAIRGNLIVLFGIWHAVQKDSVSTRGEWITLFTDLRKQKLSRMMNSLPQGLKKGSPRFWSYLTLEAAIRLAIGISLVEALWPWLSGQTTAADFAHVVGSIVAFATTILSWSCIKEFNRAAARSIQAEMDVE
jgi:hypothetical protein